MKKCEDLRKRELFGSSKKHENKKKVDPTSKNFHSNMSGFAQKFGKLPLCPSI